jgi:hypothetical protein
MLIDQVLMDALGCEASLELGFDDRPDVSGRSKTATGAK